MINLEDIIRQLIANSEAILALVQTISEEQAQWKPNSETWSLEEVMGHVYNEERIDFRKHLKEMFNNPPIPWGEIPHEYITGKNCHQALEGFTSERKATIDWLRGLKSPNWEIRAQSTFGPSETKITISAGDVLVSWVEHDFLHLRQIIELLHAWNVKNASPYSVDYAGGW